jgi:DNA polymerase-3 subunit delta'
MRIDWLKTFAKTWLDRVEHGRVPHAVLVAGPVGVGKRDAARWMARTALGMKRSEVPEYGKDPPEHPDLRWIQPPEDKEAIGIEQIRELVDDLSLTSFEGGGKVAVIEPANAMTVNAANSLLKTLEEPPGDALLILLVDRVGKLPATIFSRCQRIDIAPPPEDVALGWLDRLQPGANWAEALRVAGGAPLAAIRALEELETSASLGRDLNTLGRGEGSAIETANRWAKLEPRFVLNWLSQQLKMAIISRSAGRENAAGLAIEESVLQRMDTRNLFCYLDIINRLRGQPGGSYNVQLTFESLLIDWASGLCECTDVLPLDGMNFVKAGR